MDRITQSPRRRTDNREGQYKNETEQLHNAAAGMRHDSRADYKCHEVFFKKLESSQKKIQESLKPGKRIAPNYMYD